MMERFTDAARGAMSDAFRRRAVASERDVIAALAGRRNAVAGKLLTLAGVAAGELSVETPSVEVRELAELGAEVARRRGANYVGTEHLLIAVASLPGSALTRLGATAEVLGESLSAIEDEWRSRPGAIRLLADWCRRALDRMRGRPPGA